ncbi:DUF2802 domain-containing protein [Ningiella sp. W23]|uniref:DUF2802 domain-containing protein n=1 Tax=Ningiella sp. W23 TaxID=3023715 RepID=UPI003757F70C
MLETTADNTLLWVMLSITLACIAMLLVLALYAKQLNAKLMRAIGLIDDLYKLTQAQSKQIQGIEDQSKSDVLHIRKRIDESAEEAGRLAANTELRIEKVESTVERIEEQDPALKMYSKASKLVEQGASLEDIMEASGLPRAEVEVLVSLNSKAKVKN